MDPRRIPTCVALALGASSCHSPAPAPMPLPEPWPGEALLCEPSTWHRAAPAQVVVLVGGGGADPTWNDASRARRAERVAEWLGRDPDVRADVVDAVRADRFNANDVQAALSSARQRARALHAPLVVYVASVAHESGSSLVLPTYTAARADDGGPSEWVDVASLVESADGHDAPPTKFVFDLAPTAGGVQPGWPVGLAHRRGRDLLVADPREDGQLATLATALGAGADTREAAAGSSAIEFRLSVVDADTRAPVRSAHYELGLWNDEFANASDPDCSPRLSLQPGRYLARAFADGYLTRSEVVELDESCRGATLEVPLLPDAVWIHARLTPPRRVHVRALGGDDAGSGYVRNATTTDECGAFSVAVRARESGITLELVDGLERHATIALRPDELAQAVPTRRAGWMYDFVRVLDLGTFAWDQPHEMPALPSELAAACAAAEQRDFQRAAELAQRVAGERSDQRASRELRALADHWCWLAGRRAASVDASWVPERSVCVVAASTSSEPSQALIDALAQTEPRTKLLLAPGEYAAPDTITKTVEIVGLSNGADGAVVLRASSGSIDLRACGIRLSGLTLRVPDGVRVSEPGCVLDACLIAATRGSALRVDGPNAELLARNLTITDGECGVVVANQARVRLEHARVTKTRRAALRIDSAADVLLVDSMLDQCNVGVVVEGGASLRVEGGAVRMQFNGGIDASDDTQVALYGCTLEFNGPFCVRARNRAEVVWWSCAWIGEIARVCEAGATIEEVCDTL